MFTCDNVLPTVFLNHELLQRLYNSYGEKKKKQDSNEEFMQGSPPPVERCSDTSVSIRPPWQENDDDLRTNKYKPCQKLHSDNGTSSLNEAYLLVQDVNEQSLSLDCRQSDDSTYKDSSLDTAFSSKSNWFQSQNFTQSIHRSSHFNYWKESENLYGRILHCLNNQNLLQKSVIEKLHDLRNCLIKVCTIIILSDINFASKNNVDQTLWKTAFYQVFEKIREKVSSQSELKKATLKSLLTSILTEAFTFYENLITSLERCYKIDLKLMLTSLASSQSYFKKVEKQTKLAIICCQKCLICLGDISRYNENLHETLNYGMARRYYLQARCLEPRNGHPYNQMAVIAVRTRRRLDAIYYYVRSLATAGAPIHSARESLTSLFDDARRKLVHIEDAEKQQDTQKRVHVPASLFVDAGEEWVFGKDVEDKCTLKKSSFEIAGSNMFCDSSTINKMVKKFILVFLNVHGKLFTKIELGTIDSTSLDALQMLKTLLSYPSAPVTKEMILQLLAISFFNVHEKQKHTESEKGQSILLHAIQLAFSTISILVGHVTELVHSKQVVQSKHLDPLEYPDLGVVLPAVKFSCDWMYSNQNLWYLSPPKMANHKDFDIWMSFADMCNWLCDDNLVFPVHVLSSWSPKTFRVNLPEDDEFAGFCPAQHPDHETKFVYFNKTSENVQKDLVNQCVRLASIRDFLTFLCGMEKPLLAFQNGRYVVVFETNSCERADNELYLEDITEKGAHFHHSLTDVMGLKENEGIAGLKLNYNSLKLAKEVYDKRQIQIQASLGTEKGETITQVRPRFIVPDTNCFIDHLQLVKAIMKSKKFVLCIPLLVVTELEGLSLESKSTDRYELNVNRSAQTAKCFLKQQFASSGKAELLALTNHGTSLDTISFMHQAVHSKEKNDDQILECCHKFQVQNTVKTHKTVVLLSEDRNLRVKAMLQKLPTKSIVTFCKMANII